MIDFTLYIFAKVFDLAYSTGPSERHLLKLFYDYYQPEAFNRVVIGKTGGAVWINRINVKQETCKSLSGERIKYVYRRIFNKPVYESEEKTLVEELLRHSVGFAQGIQAAVYQKRDTDEVKNFIESLKNMEEHDYRSDDIFMETRAEAQETNSTRVSERNEIHDGQIDTLQFYNMLKTHLANDNIAEFRIAFHGAAEWVNPNSERFPILTEICEKGIPIQIAINRADAAERIAMHKRDKNAYNAGLYLDFENNTARWKSFLTNYKKCYRGESKPELRLISIPLLHSYVGYVTKNNGPSVIKIVYYTYSNPYYRKNPYMFFLSGSDGYELYRQEFRYLWEENSDIVEL